MDNVERAKRPSRLPVVFTRDEAKAILAEYFSPLVSPIIGGTQDAKAAKGFFYCFFPDPGGKIQALDKTKP